MGKKAKRGADFVREFQSGELLGELLAAAGSKLSVDQVIERLRLAIEAGEQPGVVIPQLFDGEPRFEDPAQAQITFQNLLGLWDLLQSGKGVPKPNVAGNGRLPKVKKPDPVHPGSFGEEPDLEWVEQAWKYLDDLGEKGRTPLVHAFDNRQDALVTWLDDSGLSDDGYLVARHLAFELFAMLELGWPSGVGTADPESDARSAGTVPATLLAYVDEAVFEAEHDDEAPLAEGDANKVREAVERSLAALWAARRAPKSR